MSSNIFNCNLYFLSTVLSVGIHNDIISLNGLPSYTLIHITGANLLSPTIVYITTGASSRFAANKLICKHKLCSLLIWPAVLCYPPIFIITIISNAISNIENIVTAMIYSVFFICHSPTQSLGLSVCWSFRQTCDCVFVVVPLQHIYRPSYLPLPYRYQPTLFDLFHSGCSISSLSNSFLIFLSH